MHGQALKDQLGVLEKLGCFKARYAGLGPFQGLYNPYISPIIPVVSIFCSIIPIESQHIPYNPNISPNITPSVVLSFRFRILFRCSRIGV